MSSDEEKAHIRKAIRSNVLYQIVMLWWFVYPWKQHSHLKLKGCETIKTRLMFLESIKEKRVHWYNVRNHLSGKKPAGSRVSSALVLSADGRIHTQNRSCTTRTAAGTTSIRRAARLRWALTVWPTTATGTALWPWGCQEARSSAAQERIWLEETQWMAPPLTARLRPLEPPPPRWAPITDAHNCVQKHAELTLKSALDD